MIPRTWVDLIEWEHREGRDYPFTYPLIGKPVCILGGGPSLTPEVAEALTTASTCLAVNDSYKLLPSPGVVLAIDRRWWNWHGNAVRSAGHLSITGLQGKAYPPVGFQGKVMVRDRESIIPRKVGEICGLNSGHAAITLAVNLGSPRIYLAGFDMGFTEGQTHCHGGHSIPASQSNYERRFKPALEQAVILLRRAGCEVYCVTHTYAKVPTIPLETALKDLRSSHENCMGNA